MRQQQSELRESAMYWLQMGIGVAGFGGVLVAIGIASLGRSPSDVSVWTSSWFDVGVCALTVGAVVMVCSAGIRLVASRRSPADSLAALQPRYDEDGQHRVSKAVDPHYVQFEHRIGVFNPPGGTTAEQVRVALTAMAPYPSEYVGRNRPVIPYLLPLVLNGDENVGLSIQSGREELWIIGHTSTGTDGVMNAVFSGFYPRWGGIPWVFKPGERWRLTYQITSSYRQPVTFSVVVWSDNNVLRCRLEG